VYTPTTKMGDSPYKLFNTPSTLQNKHMVVNNDDSIMQRINDPVIQKMNYIIHLLEEQQHEQTNHIMEEFILYTFLGVFVIFIVDSFSRGGKYIR
jgi:hypothetical protein